MSGKTDYSALANRKTPSITKHLEDTENGGKKFDTKWTPRPEGGRVSRKRECAGSISDFSELFSDIKETKDPLADPECCACEGRGFYHALDVGEYDEQQTTVQCSCKRKQNMSDDDLDKSEEKARFELIRLCVEIALDCGYRIDYHVEAVTLVN